MINFAPNKKVLPGFVPPDDEALAGLEVTVQAMVQDYIVSLIKQGMFVHINEASAKDHKEQHDALVQSALQAEQVINLLNKKIDALKTKNQSVFVDMTMDSFLLDHITSYVAHKLGIGGLCPANLPGAQYGPTVPFGFAQHVTIPSVEVGTDI